jgi:hypothetical protein
VLLCGFRCFRKRLFDVRLNSVGMHDRRHGGGGSNVKQGPSQYRVRASPVTLVREADAEETVQGASSDGRIVGRLRYQDL